jgi:hypothetical protein
MAPNPFATALFTIVDGCGTAAALMFSVTFTVIGVAKTPAALIVIDPCSAAPESVPDGIFVGSIDTLMAFGNPFKPVWPLVASTPSHPPVLVVPTVKFTCPPVLLTLSACDAGAVPVS